MLWQGAAIVFLVSQSAWLIIYAVGSNSAFTNPLVTFGAGVIFIPTFALLLCKLLPKEYEDENGVKRRRNLFYYMCSLFAWSCTIDLIGFLEGCDLIDGYFDFYFEKGEPYLASPFGIWINFWDATVHFALYLILIYKYDNGQDYSSWGLYWFGSMVCGMFCLVIGALVGSYGADIHPAMFLNIPYIILPFYAFAHLIQLRQRLPSEQMNECHRQGLFNLLLVVGLLFSMALGFVKGLAALGSPLPLVRYFVNEYEPYILEPGKFGTMYCLFNFVFCVPAQGVLAWTLMTGGSRKTKDLSLLLAGAVAQGTFFYLVPGLSSRTPEDFRMTNYPGTVLLLNLVPVFVSHLVLYQFSAPPTENAKKD